MKTLAEHMISYARYHRDPRNIASHFVGIPMIVLAVTILLSRPQWAVGGLLLTPAWVAVALASVFYLRLHLGLGALLSAMLVGGALWAQGLAQGPTAQWLGWGLGLFFVGWVIQFVGHYYEGRKPAFVDDLIGLLQGPMFVLVELFFAMGQLAQLREAVEAGAGPVRRDPHRTAAAVLGAKQP
ncbi:MAG: hypothetical protein C4K60_10625 [Ideonella sp. MAG2]|nr:MAG: hypothetical protein C4K60_10625 [Ideonella sp. MAG2]